MRIENLRYKRVDEIIVPDQFKLLIHVTKCLATSDQIKDSLIDEILYIIKNSTNFTSIAYILNNLSYIFPRNASSYYKIYKAMQELKPFEFTPKKLYIKENEEIFPVENIFHYVAWDKLDELIIKMEKEQYDIDYKENDMSLIDAACKYGSEKCFFYFKLKRAKITDKTFLLALEGGNKNIIISLYVDEEFIIADTHLLMALKFHHNDVFEWMLENKEAIGNVGAGETFGFGNLAGLLFLLENGFNIDRTKIIQKMFIISALSSSMTVVYHYYKILNMFINIIRRTSITFVSHFDKKSFYNIYYSYLYFIHQRYLFTNTIRYLSITFVYYSLK